MTKWGWSGIGLLGASAAALLAGMAVPRRARRHPPGGSNALVLLRTNALHTDLAIPATPLVRRRLGFLRSVGVPMEAPAMTHILVGWGSEGFYPDNARPYRIGPLDLFHALVGDDSVLRFAPLCVPPGEWDGCDTILVPDAAIEALVSFVEETLEPDGQGGYVSLDHPGITALDHFFEARPTFAALAGCNVWVSEALARAGIVSGRWTPLPQTLAASIRHHRSRER